MAALVLLLAACVSEQQDDPPQQLAAVAPCTDEVTDKLVREMTLKAVDQSFQDHVQRLFDTWMREETPDQAQRVQRGMTKAIKAYLQSRAAIERWQGACR